MSKRVALIGASAIPVGKYQTTDQEDTQIVEHEIMVKLVKNAMADAGVTKEDIQSAIFTKPRDYTKQSYFHTFLISHLQLKCTGNVMEVMGNGMTGALAFDQAANEILLGRANVALALGINMESATPAHQHMMTSMRTTGDVDFHSPAGFTPISWYAMDATRYMFEHQATREDLAAVAVKNRYHASFNPLAQYRTPISISDVIDQRPIVEPLGLFDVPPRGDGAVCLVLASEEIAKALGKPYILLKGRGFYHEGLHQISDKRNDMIAFNAARRAAETAYKVAGLTPQDIDIAEFYAPCTIVEVLVSEALELVKRGQGARAASEGETRLGGRIPISTSGGLTSRGHPALVTSLYNYAEILEQLRHEAGERQVKNARIGITTGELGNYNSALVHIFERMQ